MRIPEELYEQLVKYGNSKNSGVMLSEIEDDIVIILIGPKDQTASLIMMKTVNLFSSILIDWEISIREKIKAEEMLAEIDKELRFRES